jgi:hypothetical protein
LKRESLGELLAKCAAEDGFSIHAITKSFVFREFITKRGYKMPRSRSTVRKLILDFYVEKRDAPVASEHFRLQGKGASHYSCDNLLKNQMQIKNKTHENPQ